MKKIICSLFIAVLSSCGGGGGDGRGDDAPNRQEFSSLGRKIFFDTNLSSPKGVSCGTCHSPQAAFSDPEHGAVSRGAVPGTKGTRNTPSIMYALFSPVFGFSDDEGDFVGGQFWDGSAVDLEQQTKRPLFRHIEMNITDTEELRNKILEAPYADEFRSLYGDETLNNRDQAMLALMNAIAAFENSPELRPFSSKYDAWAEGRVQLTEQEKRGLQIFNSPNKGNCAACHPSTGDDGSPRRALFTDFTYDNIGLPRNPAANQSADIGLQGNTGRPSDVGRFKVPTLRNVEITAPYFHNGVFKTLKEAVHFYNARDVDSSIASPEFGANMNIKELGDLGLSDLDEEDLVVFLRTLTDGYAVEGR